MKRLLLPALAAASLLLLSCGTESHRPVDSFGAFNLLGGAARGNDFSLFDTAPAAVLDAQSYDSLHGGFLGAPLPMADGRLVLLNENGVVAFIQYRSLLKRVKFAESERPLPGIAADASGMVYVATTAGIIHAIDSAGSVLWRQPIGKSAAVTPVYHSGLLGLDDGVVVGGSDGTLARFDHAGGRRWEIRRGASLAGMLAGDPGLGIVTAVSFNDYDRSDTLLVVDPRTGAEVWARPLQGGRILYGPVIARDMIVIGGASRDSSGDRHPFVAAFAPGGNLLWRASLPVMPRGISTDDQGNVYVTGSGVGRQFIGGAVLSFDRAGKRRWQVTLESGVPAPAVIGKQWIYFVARRDGRTGLFTYDRNGTFAKFLAIDMLPDVQAQATISSDGTLFLSALDAPVLLRGVGEGIKLF